MQGASYYICQLLTPCGLWAGWSAGLLLPCCRGSGVALPAWAEGSCDSHLLSLALWGLMIQVLMYFLVGCRSNWEIGRCKSTAPTCLRLPACLPPQGLWERAPGGQGEARHKAWWERTGRWPQLWRCPVCPLCMDSSESCCWEALQPFLPIFQ